MQEIHVVLVLMPSPSTIHIGLISTTPETIDIAVFLIVYRSARLPKLKRQYQGGKKLFGLQDTASMHLLLSKSSIYQPPHGCFVQTVTRDCFLCVPGVYILPNSWKIEAEYTPLVCPDANVMINFDEFVFFLTTSSARYLVGRP